MDEAPWTVLGIWRTMCMTFMNLAVVVFIVIVTDTEIDIVIVIQ